MKHFHEYIEDFGIFYKNYRETQSIDAQELESFKQTNQKLLEAINQRLSDPTVSSSTKAEYSNLRAELVSYADLLDSIPEQLQNTPRYTR